MQISFFDYTRRNNAQIDLLILAILMSGARNVVDISDEVSSKAMHRVELIVCF